MRTDIEIERDDDCRGMLFQSDKPIAYTGHSDNTPIKNLFIPDSTMAVIAALIKETKKNNVRFWLMWNA